MFLQLLHCSASFFTDALISPARASSSLLFPQLQNPHPAETTLETSPRRAVVWPTRLSFSIYCVDPELCTSLFLLIKRRGSCELTSQ